MTFTNSSPRPTGSHPQLLTPLQAADALAISPRKLWQMTKDGEIASIKIGRLVRYDIRDLQRWIESRKQSAGS